MFEITSTWMDQYVSALILLNILIGHATATAPIEKPAPESLALTLNEIAHNSYRPDQHFSVGGPRVPFRLKRKELVATDNYTVVVLNARTAEIDFVSVDSGGVIFEDPAWAVFAAECLAQKQMLGVPLARTETELWEQLPRLENSVMRSTYIPSHFFSPITGFIDPSGPSFSLLEVTGAQLTALRARGVQSFGKPKPKFYILFKPPVAPR
jgi:hypothetical protein